MIFFSNLEALDKHQSFLQKRIHNPHLFLVGGCVRDLLLGITKDPIDIDFTMAGNPLELYAEMNTKGLSHFITEKFGTITLIHQKDKERNYQLTPLRTEGGYGDFRHPEEIQRSNSLILDSQRRDFSINAMYYFSIKQQTKKELDFTSNEPKSLNEKELVKILDQEGYCYLANLNLLILRDENFIEQVFSEGKFDEDYFRYLIEIQKTCYFWTEGESIPLMKGEDPQSGSGGSSKKNPLSPLYEREWSKINKFRILIDPHAGVTSLVERKLATVGEAERRFGEDALRVIRGIRLVNVCNHALLLKEGEGRFDKKTKSSSKVSQHLWEKAKLFDFVNTTRDSIKKNAHLLQHVAKERLKDEICKAFTKGNPFNFIVLLEAAGILPILFPALGQTKNADQPIRYHAFDVYAHTLLTLKALQELNSDYLVRFAMLYHDVGKVAQYTAYEKATTKEERGEIAAGKLNHRNSSPLMMKEDFKKLWFSTKEINDIARYIAEHHTPGEILSANPVNREKKVRKLLSEKGYETVNNLFDINIADRMGQFNPLQNSSDLTDSYELKNILKKLNEEEGQFQKSNLAVNGTVLMQELWLEAWPILGEVLEKIFEWVINNIEERNNEKEILVYAKSYLKNRAEK